MSFDKSIIGDGSGALYLLSGDGSVLAVKNNSPAAVGEAIDFLMPTLAGADSEYDSALRQVRYSASGGVTKDSTYEVPNALPADAIDISYYISPLSLGSTFGYSTTIVGQYGSVDVPRRGPITVCWLAGNASSSDSVSSILNFNDFELGDIIIFHRNNLSDADITFNSGNGFLLASPSYSFGTPDVYAVEGSITLLRTSLSGNNRFLEIARSKNINASEILPDTSVPSGDKYYLTKDSIGNFEFEPINGNSKSFLRGSIDWASVETGEVYNIVTIPANSIVTMKDLLFRGISTISRDCNIVFTLKIGNNNIYLNESLIGSKIDLSQNTLTHYDSAVNDSYYFSAATNLFFDILSVATAATSGRTEVILPFIRVE